ncbi:MAG: histidinol-phosphate transaminase [Alphaproteobacteria bacterium]|nr:histidinol-phosphate transaminase [Alphaproteobacteria bacterium]
MNEALENLIRPHYLTHSGYVSAGMESDKSEEKIFLNANENPYALQGLEGFNRYPEPQPAVLRQAYAQAYSVKENAVVMTRGADEAIAILTKIFCEPHQDKILICPPTFGMYGVNAKAAPAKITEVPLKKERGTFALDKENIIKTAQNQSKPVKLVYICSPNNPTGTSFSHTDIIEICQKLEGYATVILDETYAEFSQQGSLSGKLESLPNLIILRTLSKSYALAGMRMGCLLNADEDFTALVRTKALDAYPLPRASIKAALHVLSPDIHALAMQNIHKILDERTRMEKALAQSSEVTHIYPSDANFLLVEMPRADEFHAFTAKNNVILRNFSDKLGTENCLRISIGTPEENNRVLELLSRF